MDMSTGRRYASYWPGPGPLPWALRLRRLLLRPWWLVRYHLRWWFEDRFKPPDPSRNDQ